MRRIVRMKILIADTDDIPELFALQRIAFETEAEMIGSRSVPALLESEEHFRKDFVNWVTLKLTDDCGRIIGAIRYQKSDGIIEIGRVMVHQDYRRKGLAQRLLAEVEHRCQAETYELYTCTKSWKNIRLYEKMGYKQCEEVEGEDGLSFVYMRKS